MANFTIDSSSDFKKIFLISDDAGTNTIYPVIEIFINGVKEYTSAVDGEQTIDGEEYNTTDEVKDLDYEETLTSNGTKYIYEINTENLGSSGDLGVLEDGVWKIRILSDTEDTENLGVVIHHDIDCCMAKKLDKVFDNQSGVNSSQVHKEVDKIFSILQSSIISASLKEFTNAEQKYDIVSLLCSDCNC